MCVCVCVCVWVSVYCAVTWWCCFLKKCNDSTKKCEKARGEVGKRSREGNERRRREERKGEKDKNRRKKKSVKESVCVYKSVCLSSQINTQPHGGLMAHFLFLNQWETNTGALLLYPFVSPQWYLITTQSPGDCGRMEWFCCCIHLQTCSSTLWHLSVQDNGSGTFQNKSLAYTLELWRFSNLTKSCTFKRPTRLFGLKEQNYLLTSFNFDSHRLYW